MKAAKSPDLTVVIPALNEGHNLKVLLPKLWSVLEKAGLSSEIVVIDGGSRDDTEEAAKAWKAKVFVQQKRGYGGALKEGFKRARGRYVLTLDADLTHDPTFICKMWKAKEQAEVVIASRYVPGGLAQMPRSRYFLSLLLNKTFSRILSLPVRDLSSGFRLYRRDVLKGLVLESVNFDILEEILIKLYIRGYRIREIPFIYVPRMEGQSNVRLLPFMFSFLSTLYKMWKLRNTIEACDYDERAFDSIIPLQRYWQRKRHSIIVSAAFKLDRVLDIGCGSSRILTTLPQAIGMDIDLKKLNYMRQYEIPLVCGTIFSLPFKTAELDGVIASEVIEHVPEDPCIWREISRVLKPGGTLILGTPDYSSKIWLALEWIYKRVAPGGYADEHITHYTPKKLRHILKKHGFVFKQQSYILHSEVIMVFEKK